jgi:hypothetical protein
MLGRLTSLMTHNRTYLLLSSATAMYHTGASDVYSCVQLFFSCDSEMKTWKKFSQKSHSRCLLTVSMCAGTNTNSWEPQHHKSQTAYWRITGAAKSPLAALAFSKCSTSSQSGLHMLNSTITWTLHKCMPGFHTLSFMWCQMKMITMRALNRWMLYFSFGNHAMILTLVQI